MRDKMMYYLVYKNEKIDSYGAVSGKKAFQKEKEVLECLGGVKVKLVNKGEFEKWKKKIDAKYGLTKKQFKVVIKSINRCKHGKYQSHVEFRGREKRCRIHG
jgi:hypothetical protein